VPITLRTAIVLLFVEAAGVAAVAVLFAYVLVHENPNIMRKSALSVIIYPAGIAVALALLAWLLIRRRAWARAPAIVLQLLLLPIGYYLIVGGAGWLGVPAIVAGLVCTGLLIAPGTRQALGIR